MGSSYFKPLLPVLSTLVILLQLNPCDCTPTTRQHSSSNKEPSSLIITSHAKKYYGSRGSRAIEEIRLRDPLDCLSQIVCGLNTYPPQRPSAKSSTANDFAFLLKNVVSRLKKQDEQLAAQNKSVKIKIPPKEQLQNDEDYSEEDDQQNDSSSKSDETDDTGSQEDKKNATLAEEDVISFDDLYPPLGVDRLGKLPEIVSSKQEEGLPRGRRNKVQKKKLSKGEKKTEPPSPLERLRMETDLREKLRSDATCINGIADHTCPFRYEHLMVLISGVLERQRAISFSTNKILPMVGFLLKSQSLTETLRTTFTALERINNITIAKDKAKEPISVSDIYEEILNGELGNIGIRIVETRNEVAASNAWEDDEFDEALNNPVIKKEKLSGYSLLKNKKKDIKESDESLEDDNNSDSDERPSQGPPNGGRPPPSGEFEEIFPSGIKLEDDQTSNESEGGKESEEMEDLPLPPLYGLELMKLSSGSG